MIEQNDLSVLFVCTHNAARSQIAEAIMNARKAGVRAYSAGSMPRPAPHPLAVELLKSYGHPIAHLRSKSWEEFARPDAPRIDYVISVCDEAAAERCPTLPGHPISARWGVKDPSAFEGGAVARRVAFVRTYRELEQKIDTFLEDEFRSSEVADVAERIQAQERLDLIGSMMWTPKRDEDEKWPEPLFASARRELYRA